jgi:hypothetical protein
MRASRSGWCTGPIFAAFAEDFPGWLTRYRARTGVAPSAEAFLILDNAQLHAHPGALRVFRANHLRVITLPPHCTHLLQPVDAVWTKPLKDHFPTLVRSRTDQDLTMLFCMLNWGAFGKRIGSDEGAC